MSKKSLVTVLAIATLSGLSAFFFTNSAWAGGFGNDSRACAVDRPCFEYPYKTQGGGIFMKWSATESYSRYNMRWSRPGKNAVQVEVGGGSSGSFHLKNSNPGMTYTFAVQGCNKHFLASSTCSPWESIQFRN